MKSDNALPGDELTPNVLIANLYQSNQFKKIRTYYKANVETKEKQREYEEEKQSTNRFMKLIHYKDDWMREIISKYKWNKIGTELCLYELSNLPASILQKTSILTYELTPLAARNIANNLAANRLLSEEMLFTICELGRIAELTDNRTSPPVSRESVRRFAEMVFHVKSILRSLMNPY